MSVVLRAAVAAGGTYSFVPEPDDDEATLPGEEPDEDLADLAGLVADDEADDDAGARVARVAAAKPAGTDESEEGEAEEASA